MLHQAAQTTYMWPERERWPGTPRRDPSWLVEGVVLPACLRHLLPDQQALTVASPNTPAHDVPSASLNTLDTSNTENGKQEQADKQRRRAIEQHYKEYYDSMAAPAWLHRTSLWAQLSTFMSELDQKLRGSDAAGSKCLQAASSAELPEQSVRHATNTQQTTADPTQAHQDAAGRSNSNASAHSSSRSGHIVDNAQPSQTHESVAAAAGSGDNAQAKLSSDQQTPQTMTGVSPANMSEPRLQVPLPFADEQQLQGERAELETKGLTEEAQPLKTVSQRMISLNLQEWQMINPPPGSASARNDGYRALWSGLKVAKVSSLTLGEWASLKVCERSTCNFGPNSGDFFLKLWHVKSLTLHLTDYAVTLLGVKHPMLRWPPALTSLTLKASEVGSDGGRRKLSVPLRRLLPVLPITLQSLSLHNFRHRWECFNVLSRLPRLVTLDLTLSSCIFPQDSGAWTQLQQLTLSHSAVWLQHGQPFQFSELTQLTKLEVEHCSFANFSPRQHGNTHQYVYRQLQAPTSIVHLNLSSKSIQVFLQRLFTFKSLHPVVYPLQRGLHAAWLAQASVLAVSIKACCSVSS